MISNGYGINSGNVNTVQVVNYVGDEGMQKCPFMKQHGKIFICSCAHDMNKYDTEVSEFCMCSQHPDFDNWVDELSEKFEKLGGCL